jgi:ATP-binding cassette, subfamily B, bacterial MsbA
MKYFAKALKQAWRHWPALVLGLLCSVAVAALWGANIAAIFPIIETTLHGDSLQSWNQKRLDTAQKSLTAHQAKVTELEKKLATAADPAAKRELSLQLGIVSS